MAEPAPATEQNEARRIEMLRAAAELICERGFGDTRIADVAKRAGVSSALVIYYFGTRDRLLVDALRYSEESFYEAAEQMLAEVPSLTRATLAADQVDVRAGGQRRDTGRLGTVVRPVGAGISARRDQGRPSRTRRAVAQDDRRRDQVCRAGYEGQRPDVRAGVRRPARRPVDPGRPWTTRRSTPTSPTTSLCTSRSGNSTCRLPRNG